MCTAVKNKLINARLIHIHCLQARARAELREEATVTDANDVISLVKHSLIDTFSDEFGNIQLSRSINGSGVSSRNKVSICCIENLLKSIFVTKYYNLKANYNVLLV